MNEVIAEVQKIIAALAGMPGQEPSIKYLQNRLGELYAQQAEELASYRSSRN